MTHIIPSLSEARGLTEKEIAQALENDEIAVYFQPKWSLVAGTYHGVEALARIESRKYGIISPDKFVPMAEETGQIKSIGERILHQACKEHNTLRRLTGRDNLTLAVNVSGTQIHATSAASFAQTVANVLQDTQTPPELLDLELTETTWCHPTEHMLDQLTGLADKGIHLVVDDFGAGAAGLNRLLELPVQGVKVDKAFVSLLDRRDTPGQRRLDPHKLLKEIIHFIKALGLTLVVEGVEREDQASWLQEQGCQIIQGYLIGHPMTPAALVEHMNQTALIKEEREPLLSLVGGVRPQTPVSLR